MFLSSVADPPLETIDTDNHVEEEGNQSTNAGIRNTELHLLLFDSRHSHQDIKAKESTSQSDISHGNEKAGHALPHLIKLAMHIQHLLVTELDPPDAAAALSPLLTGLAHGLSENLSSDLVEAHDGQEVVDDGGGEEEGEDAEAAVAAEEGTWVVGFGRNVEGGLAVALHRGGDDEGDDVVECEGGSEHLHDEGAGASTAGERSELGMHLGAMYWVNNV